MDSNRKIGFACAYTPLAVIHAAGFTPWRVLPSGDSPDQAGHILHDNLCPHVKRILDRAMARDIPDLSGMVFMNSCDAMRRLHDAWRTARPDVPAALIDLPVNPTGAAIKFFEGELRRFADTLASWGGRAVTPGGLKESVEKYNRIGASLADLRERVKAGTFPGGPAALQEAYNRASMEDPDDASAYLDTVRALPPVASASPAGTPIFLFGNVLPDPEAFALFESCGARIIYDDLCTGSRLFTTVRPAGNEDPMAALAREILNRKPCARTISADKPGRLSELIASDAVGCGAKGVIGHTVKFCDPYIARLPSIRAALKNAGLPFLILEGDCTLRSMGQQKTRIEAFIEMLG